MFGARAHDMTQPSTSSHSDWSQYSQRASHHPPFFPTTMSERDIDLPWFLEKPFLMNEIEASPVPDAKAYLESIDCPVCVMAYFDLSSYLYLSRLIHDASLIIPELSVLLDRLYCSYICTHARVNAYQTYPLSRYSATILLNAHTRVPATYLPIPYRYSHTHSPSWSTHSESYPSLYL